MKKINELTEKLEKSENKFKIVNDTNNKLLEVINIFKVLQTIDKNQKKQNHSNNKSKKKVRSPSLNENFEKGNHDTKENSEYPKITSRRKSTKLILKDTNELRTNAFSLPMKGTQYSMPNSFKTSLNSFSALFHISSSG